MSKKDPVKLPKSVYIVLWAAALTNMFVSFVMLKYFM